MEHPSVEFLERAVQFAEDIKNSAKHLANAIRANSYGMLDSSKMSDLLHEILKVKRSSGLVFKQEFTPPDYIPSASSAASGSAGIRGQSAMPSGFAAGGGFSSSAGSAAGGSGHKRTAGELTQGIYQNGGQDTNQDDEDDE